MRTAVLPDSSGGARDARVAPPGLGLCRYHVAERHRPLSLFHSWTYSRSRDLSATRAGLLFFSFSACSGAVADVSAAAHGAGGFSTANWQLTVANWRTCGFHSGRPGAHPAIIVHGVSRERT